jgi:hypothetical protein
VEDVDRETAGAADGGMKRARAIDAHDHRGRLHAHGIDGGRRHGVPRLAVPAGHDGDGAGEPAQGELGLGGELLVEGDGGLHCVRSHARFFFV